MKKNVTMILILVVLLSIALVGTYAYQTYTQDTIENTFTIGDVSVELYEKGSSENLKEGQTYELERGKVYEKNMVVNVNESSEDCYVYIVMQNDLAAAEAETSYVEKGVTGSFDYTRVSDQIESHGWNERNSEVDNVKIYWKAIDADSMAGEIQFMDEFRTAASFDYDAVRKSDKSSPVMSFTLYAIEKGSLGEAEAWNILKTEFSELGSY